VKIRLYRYQVLFILVFLSAIYALATGFLIFSYLTVFLLLVLFVGFIWSRLLLRGITIEVQKRIPNTRVGDLVTGYLRVRNQSMFSKLALEIRELSDEDTLQSGRVIDMKPHSIQGWKTNVSPGRRGVFSLGPVQISGSDLFGLFRVVKTLSDIDQITVWPNTQELPFYYPELSGKNGDSSNLKSSFQPTPNISHVREYIPGDSLGRIHWVSTAKTGELMVKQFDDEIGADHWVIVDLNSQVHTESLRFSTEEFSISVAASICERLVDLKLPVGVITSGISPQLVAVERGYEHHSKIMNSLAMSGIGEELDLLTLIQKLPEKVFTQGNLLIITPSSDINWLNFLSINSNSLQKATTIFIANDNESAKNDFVDSRLVLSKMGINSYVVSPESTLGHSLISSGINFQK
tara:strand:+ start:1376 stop:2593 length:1218 start_codon:yes stop_codon:yes gene_type:complete